jgi:hypothetical protein
MTRTAAQYEQNTVVDRTTKPIAYSLTAEFAQCVPEMEPAVAANGRRCKLAARMRFGHFTYHHLRAWGLRQTESAPRAGRAAGLFLRRPYFISAFSQVSVSAWACANETTG